MTFLREHLEQTKGASRVPLRCQWEITCRCNFKCVMCYTDCFNKPEHIARELSTQEILRIMDQLRDAGVLELVLTGGEPMARPDFETIYRHAVTSGFLVTIFTNGAYITQKWAELWKELKPFKIEISFHGATPGTFDQVTGRAGSFGKVMAAVQLLIENNLPLTIKSTALTLNHAEILKIKDWARSLGTGYRLGEILRPEADGGTSVLSWQLPEKTREELLAGDSELSADAARLAMEDEIKPSACHEGRVQFHIDAYGTLQLCSNNRRQGYSLRGGNFEEGFYKHLPDFACPNKAAKAGQEGAHASI